MLVEQLSPRSHCSALVNAGRLFTAHQQIAEILEVGGVKV